MEHWTQYLKFLISLVVIIDPFASIPVLLLMTRGFTKTERLRFCHTAAATVAFVLSLGAIAGERFLDAIGTSFASFQVGGGIVLLLMALAMLSGKPDEVNAPGKDRQPSSAIAVVPVAIPLLAGPGAISTVIIEMHLSTAPHHWLGVVGAILVAASLLWLVLWLAVPIGERLGVIGLNIINRLFGMILVAIAVEIMANGLRALFPALTG